MKSIIPLVLVACATVTSTPTSVTDELATKKALTLGVTKKMAAAAEAFAVQKGWNVVIAIVDDGGHLIYLARMDGAQTGSVAVAQEKAKASVGFKRPTSVFSDGVAGGNNALLRLSGTIPFAGGVPIKVGDEILGAIGVSGVTDAQDAMIATAGVESLAKILSD